MYGSLRCGEGEEVTHYHCSTRAELKRHQSRAGKGMAGGRGLGVFTSIHTIVSGRSGADS
jgi:hypothetical protein